MVVVSDTSPLSAMAKLNWLEWLRERWKVVILPQEVWDELGKIGDKSAWERLVSARRANWLRVEVAPVRTLPELSKLDPGEVAAILLALGLGAERILMDEADGRRAAKLLGLTPVGVLSMVVWAKEQGLIPAIMPAIQELRTRTRFRISPTLLAIVAKDAGESHL